MPTIITVGNLKIQIFADDHNPPHFHVVTPEHEALIRLSDLSLMAGSLSGRDFRIALQWAQDHLKELDDEWNRLNAR